LLVAYTYSRVHILCPQLCLICVIVYVLYSYSLLELSHNAWALMCTMTVCSCDWGSQTLCPSIMIWRC